MCTSATSSTANRIWVGLGSDQDIYGEIPVTYSLMNYVVTANVREVKHRT